MRFERIKSLSEKNIGFYDFSEGIDENSVNEARLVDAENVILKGRKAVSRKGLKASDTPFFKPEALNCADISKNEFSMFYNGEYRKILVFTETDDATYVKYSFKMLCSFEEEISLGEFRFTPASSGSTAAYPLSVFAFAGKETVGQGIYAVFSFMRDPVNMQGAYMKIYEYAGSGVWSELSDSDIYIPTVYKNGRGSNYSISEKKFPEPQTAEKKNMLSKKAKYYFNADGASDVFTIPADELSTAQDAYIECNVRLADNSVIQFIVSGSNISSEAVLYDGASAFMTVDRSAKKISFNSFVPPFVIDEENTIEVIVHQSEEENIKKLANMSFGMWYNAGSSGTRLFIAGNELYPSLLMASEPDQPLYFPIDNQFFVGDPTQKITALARQNKSLVVFKEKEIYCGSYSSGKFSVSHLHSAIGCDLPSTVALCGNRVVWATTEKCIYTLNALSDYGAVAVYRLSSKIENALEKLDFSDACAGYRNDVYYLFLKERVCVMNVSGALLQSNKQFLESAAFTFWKLPEGLEVQLAAGMQNELKLVCNTLNECGQVHFTASFSGNGVADEIIYRTATGVRKESRPFYSMLEFENSPGIEAVKRSFYKAYVSCYAQNGLEAEMSDVSGDIHKRICIDLKYTRLSLPAPYRFMPLIGAADMILRLKSGGEFSCSGYTLYYQDFI
ncbi:MAG: hypothetical protein KBS52_03780 [Clostridiales bacterium]|nr:hypothetical protein [Candidatus Equinaster intestinalis]